MENLEPSGGNSSKLHLIVVPAEARRHAKLDLAMPKDLLRHNARNDRVFRNAVVGSSPVSSLYNCRASERRLSAPEGRILSPSMKKVGATIRPITA
jgi:hypothetical protein